MIKKIIAGLLLTAASSAFAESPVQLLWDKPILREDNTELLPTDINGYYIKHWDDNVRLDNIYVDGADSLEYVISSASSGVHVFQIATVADGGSTGSYSDPIGLYIPEEVTPAPAAPVTFKVEISCVGCIQ